MATAAPVATDGIRPCRALKPWLYWRKYAGVLLEQPIPLNFTVEYGLTPTDLHASIRWLVMLLWPHPLQSVEGSPWKANVGRRQGVAVALDQDRRFAGHESITSRQGYDTMATSRGLVLDPR